MGISAVGVIGAGTMGNGIAQACAVAGLTVTTIDISAVPIRKGMSAISRSLDRLVTKRELTAEGKRATLDRIQGTEDYDALQSAEVVIEAATESSDLKLSILGQLDGVASPGAVIATNTSSLSITRLASASSWPERVLQEGLATAAAIDAGMKLGCNHPMGPLALADLIGLDTLLSVMEVFYAGFGDSKYRPAPLLREMVDAGRLGRKSGQGFYRYQR